MYIGQTTKKNPRERFNGHVYDSKKSTKPISLAIKEFGRDSFVFQICKICSSKEELNEQEGLLIEKYETYKEEKGYNLDRYIDGKTIRDKSTVDKLRKHVCSDKMKEKTRNTGYKNRGIKRDKSSKYIGVSISPNKRAWLSCIYVNNRRIGISYHYDEIEAAMAVDIFLLEYLGKDVILNFPQLKDDYISGTIIIDRRKKSKKESIKFRGFKTQYREEN